MSRHKVRVGREQELRALANDPAQQTALALRIVAGDRDTLNLRAALAVLQAHPTGQGRQPLLDSFAYYMADGVRRDAGTYLRAAILMALRPVASIDDLPLLENAAATYEFLPPGRSEEAALLRSTALVALNELDDKRGALQSVRLLADRYTSALSGEPALTAVRVLAAGERFEPLYYYALHQSAPQSDVLSECLRSLSGLPQGLAQELVEKYRATDDEVVLVGLLDMALDGADSSAFIAGFLAQTRHLAVYRYLVTRLVAAHREPWLAELQRQANVEIDPAKLGILEDALALGRDDPAIHRALAAVRLRRGNPRKARRGKAND
jgi:hypothetical protein